MNRTVSMAASMATSKAASKAASTATTPPGRIARWIRKGYPRFAPEHGHNYLIALCAPVGNR